jgi:hypothetical protein
MIHEMIGFEVIVDLISLLVNIYLIVSSILESRSIKHHNYQNVQTVFLIILLESQVSK